MVTVSGGKDGRRYNPVYNLCSSLSNITCQILPSLHALTGCDTTSAFIRIGKKQVYQFLKTSPEELSDLFSLTSADLESTINTTRHALSLLYAPKGTFKSCHHDLNMLLVKLATSKDVLLSRIPHSEPSFQQHVLRSSLQATVWFCCLQSRGILPLIFDLLYHVFTTIFVVCIDVLTPVLTLLFISYSFYGNSDTFRCNKMHIYHAYCRNNLKRQSVFTRPMVSQIGQLNDVMKRHTD